MGYLDNELKVNYIKALYFLRDAIVTPTSINRIRNAFTGCVYDRRGNLFSASQRTSRNVRWKPADPDSIDPMEAFEEISGCCIYLGHYTTHYGHFLLETLSRFWVFDMNIKYDRLIFQPFVHSVPKISSFSPAKICFECFNIQHGEILVIKKKSRFENLVVPTMLLRINNEASEEQALIYQKIIEYCRCYEYLCKLSPSRIYLSRKKRRSKRCSIVNEDEVEKLFISLDFTVVYPEKISFEKQVTMYNRADIVSGFSGSAMHNSVFMREGSLVITIGTSREGSTPHRNQVICDSLSKVQSEFIRFEGKVVNRQFQVGEFDTHYLRRELGKLI
jgi:hypothetical protein